MKRLLLFFCLFLAISIPVVLVFLVAFHVYNSIPFEFSNKVLELAIRISLTLIVCILELFCFISMLRPFSRNTTEYKYILRHAFATDELSQFKLLLCFTLYNINLTDSAIKGLTKLLSRCKVYQDSSAVLFFLAKCYQKNNMPKKAIHSYETLLKTDISNSSAWTNLGLLYESKGYTDKAKDALEQALIHDPGNITAYSRLANIHYQYSNYEQAKYYSLKAYLLDATAKDAISTAALAYANLGDAENARNFCDIYGALADNEYLSSLVESRLRIWNKYHKEL